MDAGPQHTHRDLSGDAVHVLFRQQPSLFHSLLIPAHADEVTGMLRLNPGLTARHHFINIFNAHQRHIPAEHGVVEQVHMGIIKARQHTGAVKVLFLIPSLGQRLLICPQKHNFPILNTNGLISAYGLIHRKNRSVIAKGSHIDLPFFPFSLFPLSQGANSVPTGGQNTKRPPYLSFHAERRASAPLSADKRGGPCCSLWEESPLLQAKFFADAKFFTGYIFAVYISGSVWTGPADGQPARWRRIVP